MLTFLRKIRRSLLDSGRFSRYLIYAIGEIALVVIGILIALQINNWNETRSKITEISNIYRSVIDELQGDSEKLDEILPDFQWKIRILEKISQGASLPQEWIQNDSLVRSFASFYDFNIGQERFQLLKSKVAINDDTQNLNNRIADFYKKHSTDIGVRTLEANMSYHRNMEYWEENEDWFTSVWIDNDFTLLGKYASTSTVFKNKITWYRIMLARLEYSLRAYQAESQELMVDIRLQLDNLD